jgi:outer membrane lipoprotein-sorting protein
MSLFSRYPVTRWLVPAAAVAVVLGGTTLIRSAVNDSGVSPASLPSQTTSQLLTDVATAKVDGLSGTVVQTSNLGIPDFPGLDVGGGSSLTSLLSGSHTLRVWIAGSDQQRLSLLSTLGETDVVHNGKDLWIWNSHENTASHQTVSQRDRSITGTPGKPMTSMPPMASTPQAMAQMILAALAPSTSVTTGTNDTVAGRPAYELVLQPKDTRSLISSIRIAVDGTKHIPLRLQVLGKGLSDPAFEIAFTSVDFTKPDSAEFAFNPPPGAIVTQDGSNKANTAPAKPNTPECAAPPASASASALEPRVVGSGWTTVMVASLPTGSGVPAGRTKICPGTAAAGTSPSSMLGSLASLTRALPTASGSWGTGHVLKGTILTVVITDDGRIAVGAVPPSLVYSALATK